MTEIRIENPIERGFAMVPDVLWAWPDLSFRAKGFMAFLLSFRGGFIPPVAALEIMTGLSRDVRRHVMKELQVSGLARWEVQKDKAGRVVAKTLVVDTRPLLAASLSGELPDAGNRAPENPAHGGNTVRLKNRRMEKSVPSERSKRSLGPENPGDLIETETDKGAAPAAPQRASGVPAPVAGVAQSARDGEGGASGEAAQGAENYEVGLSGGAVDDFARCEREALRRADVSASVGQRVRCPLSGEWMTAARWIAKRAGEGVSYEANS